MRSYNKIIYLWLLILPILGNEGHAQQNVQFTHYMLNPVVFNPAYAGADQVPNITAAHRSQWGKVEGAPQTQILTAHAYAKQQRVGLGLGVINDRIGAHKELQAMAMAAYHLPLADDKTFSVGLQAGFNNRRSDYLSLGSNALNDPRVPANQMSTTHLQLGTGFYYRSESLQIGLSVPELLPARATLGDTTVNFENANYYGFAKYRIPLTGTFDLEPSLLIKYLKGLPVSYDINATLVYQRAIALGFSYRKSESIDLLFRAQATPQLQVAYGYDHPIGNAASIGSGSHELVVQYLMRFSRPSIPSPR
jgi:type IX secretion system PorP/SprF family membrane protein